MMKILFAGRPHALIRRIDTSAAVQLPGVLAVFTARDVPVNEYGLILPDQPVLCGPGSDRPQADRVRFVGDQVAVVVAETEAIAAEGVRRIAVDYEDLAVELDAVAAMREGATLLHPEKGSNVFCRYRIRRGEVEAALARATRSSTANTTHPHRSTPFCNPRPGWLTSMGRAESRSRWRGSGCTRTRNRSPMPSDCRASRCG